MADGPDDPKQKADKAWRWCERQWDRAPSPSQMVEAAVTASIEAALAEALAPVLERVARLEKENAPMTVEALADAVQAVLATLKQREADGPAVTPAPCAICNGARWVCDVSVDGASYHRKPCPDCSKPAASMVTDLRGTIAPGTAISVDVGPGQNLSPAESEGTLQHNPGLGSVTMSTEQAAALLKSSKPAASTEGHEFAGRIMWTVEGVPIDLRKPASLGECCVLGCDKPTAGASAFCMERHHAPPQNPSPAESEGETACTRHRQYRCPACAAGMVEESGQWRAGRSIGRTLYIGDKCVGMVDTPELAAAIVAAMNAPSPAESEAPKTEKCTATRRAASGILLNCTRAPHDDVLLHLSVEGWLWAPEQVAPKTEEEAGPLFNFCKKCDAFRGPDVTVCNVCGSPISKLREPPKTEEARKAVGPDAQPTEPAPAATHGIPQSGPQAPERVEHVCDAECRRWVEVSKYFAGQGEAGIREANEVLDKANAQTMGLMLDKARAEGREAGIREAAEVARAMRDADTGPSEYAQGARQGLQLAGRRILALLAKKPEVGT